MTENFPILSEISLVLYDLDGTLVKLNVNWDKIKHFLKEDYQQRYNDILPSNSLVENLEYIRENQGVEDLVPYYDLIRTEELEAIQTKAEPLWLITEKKWPLKEELSSEVMYGIISNNFHESIQAILFRFELTENFKFSLKNVYLLEIISLMNKPLKVQVFNLSM
jgi:FMN phosphatase YigB (HAD superfamily)